MQAHILNGVGIESGEETERVRRIIQRDLIQQDQRLVRSAAPDIQPAADIRSRLYSGQQLKAAQQVRFANGGQLLQLRRLQRHKTRLYISLDLVRVRFNHDLPG